MFRDLFGIFQKRVIRLPSVSLLVLALGLTGAATYFSIVSKQMERETKAREVALRVSNSIDDRLATYESALLDTRSFLTADRRLGRAEFSRFIHGLDIPLHYPGVLGVGFVQRVPGTAVAAHLSSVRAEHLPNYMIWPEGNRNEYAPIVYLEPYSEAKARVLGFDMNTEPTRREAMDAARDTGVPTISRRLDLMFDESGRTRQGFVVFVPVYKPGDTLSNVAERRAALLGYVFAPFRSRDLISMVAKDHRACEHGAGLEVYDGEEGSASHLLYSCSIDAPDQPPVGRFTNQVVHKLVGNRKWLIAVTVTPRSLGEHGWPTPVYVFLVGTIASFLIYFFARAATLYAISLEKSESLLSLIANSLPTLVGYINRDRTYRYNNSAYERMFGLPVQSLRGRGVKELLGAPYETFFRPLMDRALKGETVTFEHDFNIDRSATGHCYYSCQYIPDLAPDGRVLGLVSLTNDVTDQKRFQDNLRDERRISELVNEVGMSLQAELNPEKLTRRITDVATELTAAEAGAFFYGPGGRASSDETAPGATSVSSGPLKDKLLRMPPPRKFDRIVRIGDATKEPAYAEAALRFGVRSYLAVPVISRSGQVLGGLVFAHGRPGVFTERAEKLVAGIAAQAGVALDNAKLYSESQAINRVKDEFLATLSHELRTPLNVILGYSELLKDEKLPDGLGSYVDAVYRNAKAQNQLIADLLDISAIITGKLNFQPVHINTAEVVKSAIENIRFAAESKGVALEARFESGGCPIVGDPTRIQQIVWNLLSNAVKFTPAGGRVSVSTHADHGRCVIEVGDTGIGIDADFIPYVFDRFSQEDTGRSRRFGGLGLGLSIVRQLVELHGGQIRVYSGGKDQGTQFTVSLPLAPSTPPPPRSGVEAVG